MIFNRLFLNQFFKFWALLLVLFSINNFHAQNCNNLDADAGQDIDICLGESIQIGGNPTGDWTGNGSPVITYSWSPNSNINDNTFANPTVSPTTTTTYTVTVTSTHNNGNTCDENSSIEVTVIEPQANALNSGPICAGQSFTLDETGGDAVSWQWSTNGSSSISNSTDQDPTVTGAVDGEVFTVEITDSDGCIAIASTTITVHPIPTVTLDPFSDICSNASAISLSGGNPSGGTYSGPGVSNNEFDPSAANIGNNTITYTYTDGNGCTNSATQTINVLSIPDASIWDYTSTLPNYPFTGCEVGTNNYDLVIDNTSSTIATNTNYTIDWGDSSPFYSSSTLPLSGTSHTYNTLGYFTIILTVDGQNGCISSQTYSVFNGSNPPVGFPQPGNTTGFCVVDSITVDITGTSGNPPGTTYTITNNAGDPPVVYQHPPPATYTHVFTSTSCGATGGNDPNVFYLDMRAENPCGYSDQTVQPITLSVGPISDFNIDPDTIACVNSIITFTNTSINGVNVALNQGNYVCDSITIPIWEINPSNGWSVQGGTLGSPNPNGNPNTWGSNVLDIIFTDPGEYNISLIDSNYCGPDTMTKTVCIVPVPIPSFDLDTTNGCMPLAINATNTSSSLTDCVPATYIWDVQQVVSSCGYVSSWDFINGTDSSSVHPSFIINNPGRYVVSLQVINKCDSTAFSDTITVTGPPQLTLDPIADFCGSANIQPIATIDSCLGEITAYQWSFVGGNPSSSTLLDPGTISYNQVGQFTISLDVTNACATVNASELFNVFDLPFITMPLDDSICFGESIQLLPTVSAGTPNFNYSWTPAAGLSYDTILDPMASPTVTTNYILNISDANNCMATDSILIEVLPLPIVNVVDQSVCQFDTAFLNGTISSGNAPYSYSWTPTGLLSDDQILDPYYVVISSQTFNLTVSDQFNCSSSAPLNVTMFNLPSVNAGNDTTLCNQPGTVQFNGTPPPPGGVWSGTNISSTGGFDPTGVGLYENVYTYTDPNGCINSDTMYIDVIDPTNADAGVDFEVCVDTGSVQLTGNPANGVWSGNGISSTGTYNVISAGTFDFVYSFGSGNCLTSDTVNLIVNDLPIVDAGTDFAVCIDAGLQTITGTPAGGTWSGTGVTNSLGEFDPAVAGVGSHTIYYDYTDTNTCDNVDSLLVTVNGLPIVDAGNDTTLCNQPGTVQFNGTPPPPGGVWSGTNISSTGGFDPTGVGLYENVYTYTDPNGCINSDTMYIDVIDPINADAGADFEVCVDTGSVQLTGSPSGGTWSGNGISSTGTYNVISAGTFNFTYSFGSGNCLTDDDVDVTINDLPLVNAGVDFAVCVDAGLQTLIGSPLGGTWSGPAVTSSGDFDPSIAGVGVHTLYYSYTDANTCENIDSLIATVNPLPIVDAGNDTTLCNQPGTVQFNGTPPPPGGVWSGTNISSTGGFDPTGVGLYENVYTYTDPNGCINSDTMYIDVIDPTNADAGVDFEVCVDTGSVQLTGLPANGFWSGNGISSTGLYTVVTAGTFDFTYSFGSGNCLTDDVVSLTVNALPSVDAGSDISVCIDAGLQTFVGSPSVGTWSGLAVTSSGDFDPFVAGVGSHTIYYHYTDTNTCDNVDSLVVTVNGLPIVDAGNDTTLCNQPGTVQFNGTPPPPGGVWSGTNISSTGGFDPTGVGLYENVYTYTDPNGCINSDTMYIDVIDPTNADAGVDFEVCVDTGSVQLTGLPANGFWSGNGISSTGLYTVVTAGTFDFTYSFGSGNCLTDDVVSLTVNALPSVDAGSDISVCIDAGLQTFFGSPSGGTWSGLAVTSSGDFDPFVAGVGSHTIYYHYTDTNTCDNVDSLVVTVNGLPIVDAGNDTTLCNQPGTVQFNGTPPPPGGVWSGTNISSTGGFDPTGVGLYENVYTYTDPNGCINSDTMYIDVIDPTNADAGVGFEVCVDTGSVQLTGLPANGFWSGNGISSTGLYTVVTADTFELVYSFGSGNCLTSDTLNLIVNDLPIVNAGSDISVCIDAGLQTFVGSPSGGTWSGLAVTSSGDFDPFVAGVGSHTIYYHYTDTNTCDNVDSLVVTVNGLPIVDAGNDTTLCNQPIAITLTGTPSGGDWSGIGITNIIGEFTPSGIGNFPIYYTYTDPNGCVNIDTLIINVVDPVNANAGADLSMCIDTGAIQLLGQPANGTWTGIGVGSTGVFTPTIDGIFSLTYSYGVGNCLTTDIMDLTVYPLPIVNAGADFGLCVTHSDTNLSASPIGGYWYGNGIIDSITGLFSPDSAGVGSSQIIYSYQNPLTYCWNHDTIIVQINPLPIPSFLHDSIVCMGIGVPITNTTSGAVAYNWGFSDGGSSQLQDPVYVFNNTGVFNINLIAQSNFGCLDSVMSTIQVIEPPSAIMSLIDSICYPLTVSFNNNSAGDFISFDWDLGNGVQSTDTIPQSQIYQQGVIADTTYYVELTVSNLCGVDSIVDSVTIMPQPTAIFGTNVNILCSPAVFDFANNSLGLPDNYYWDFGNGNTSITSDSLFQSTFYTGLNDTTYTIMLIVDNECGSDTAYHTVTVLPNQVNAFFNADTLSGCNPLTVNFTQFSTGALSFSWDFGDGNFSNLYSPTHTYTTSGTYTVSLAINDGCSYDTAMQTITVHPLPNPLFSAISDTLCGDQSFTFINQSAGAFSSYWEFGDGNNSVLTDPVHAYSSPGVYNVTLTITDLVYGCVNTYSDQVVSLVVPEAIISSSPTYGCMPLIVNFTNSSTNAQFYSWDFGDGNSSNNTAPVNTYINDGNYYITLIALNANGCNDTTSINVDVYPIPVPDFSIVYDDSCVLPASVSFVNNSTGAINYNWNFGDGGTAISTDPTHYYQNDGQFNVQLTVENSYGCVDSISELVIIDPIPIVSFTASPLFGCVPLVVGFSNASQNANYYNWDYGDGNVSSLISGFHTYTIAGNYVATLVVEDLNGCTDSSSVNITVYPEPVADFTYVNSDPCYPPVTVDFTNTSIGATNYTWDLGSGAPVFVTNPSKIYNSGGNYNIELIASNAYGCDDTAQTILNVYETPVASFLMPDDTICLRDSIFLTSQSSYADSLVWDLGNGEQFLWY